MARGGGGWDDELCAEHDGSISSFARLTRRIKRIDDCAELFERDSVNIARLTKVAAFSLGGVAVLGPLAFAAAPAVGGAVGSVLGFSGIVAENAGLAMLGGGPVITGGMGIAGGVAVVTATGASLGGYYGGAVAQSYFSDVDDFEVKCVKPGSGAGVVVIDGLLSQDETGVSGWKDMLEKRFRRRPWYHVRWEAKRLGDLGSLVTGATSTTALRKAIVAAASRASKSAAGRLVPVASVLGAVGLARNPWHVAMVKADQTGVLLAEILSRVHRRRRYVLIGHSLGARVIYGCLRALASRRASASLIEDVHLFGGAVGRLPQADWKSALTAVGGRIVNYHSKRDQVLNRLYRAGTLFQSDPIGYRAIGLRSRKLVERDVTAVVAGHLDFKPKAGEILR